MRRSISSNPSSKGEERPLRDIGQALSNEAALPDEGSRSPDRGPAGSALDMAPPILPFKR